MYSKSYSKCPKCGKSGTITFKEIITATRRGTACIDIKYHAHCSVCGVTVDHERHILLHNMEPINFDGPKPMKMKGKLK